MTATTPPHSVPTARADELHELAVQLYGLIGSGHDALAYNVDARGPALTAVGADGKRRPVQTSGGSDAPPPWQRARELREGGVEVDRRFNAWVLERHLRGKYAVAPAAPGWVQWVALDIDAHPAPAAPAAPEHVARRLAKARADRVLADVWRALRCSAERHPLVLRSPGGGYHVWFPLTRGPTSTNPEHTWPAAVARAWFERHLVAAGLTLAPGVLEVFPSGRCLRAPCGLGMQVLQATQPGEPDALGLVPWPGTMTSAERVDWRGERGALSAPVRRVVPMVRAFVAQWELQRRTLADWLGRPEASWDPGWGFLGWRTEGDGRGEEIPPEKNAATAAMGDRCLSQESDDVPGRLWGRGSGGPWGHGEWPVGRAGRAGRARSGSALAPPIDRDPLAPEVDVPPDVAGGRVVRGRAFKEKVRRLLEHGVTEPSTRHDAVLTLAFYWGATCGRAEGSALALLEAWCKAHPHTGSRLSARPRAFVATCIREAAHYLAHYAAKWRFRGNGDGGGLVTLAPADQAVITAADPRVRDEIAAILAWLAGRTDGAGRIGAPVQIATGLLARVCGGDRRVVEAGKRRRATTIALEELERLGVLTLAQNYVVGQHGRAWSCWYQFGSGELPRVVELTAEAWEALVPASGTRRAGKAAAPASEGRVVLEAEAPASEGRVVLEAEAPASEGRVVLEAEAPASGTRLAGKAEAPASEGRVVLEAEAPASEGRVVLEAEAPASGTRLAGKAEAPASEGRVVLEAEAPASGTRLAGKAEAPASEGRVVLEAEAPASEERLALEAEARGAGELPGERALGLADPGSAAASSVVVRVVGERVVPEGLVRVLSDGVRGAPRTLLELAPDVALPTAVPSARAPWFVRMFQRRTFTPAELWTADVAKVIPFPDVEARRRMSRRERLAWGTGTPAPVIPIHRRGSAAVPSASVAASGVSGVAPSASVAAPGVAGGSPSVAGVGTNVRAPDTTPEVAEQAGGLGAASLERHVEVGAKVGAAADAVAEALPLDSSLDPGLELPSDLPSDLPLDLADVVAQAWRAFRRGRDP